jgi:hypothetical protein
VFDTVNVGSTAVAIRPAADWTALGPGLMAPHLGAPPRLLDEIERRKLRVGPLGEH